MKKKGFAFPSVFLDDETPFGPGVSPTPGLGTFTGSTGSNGNAVGNQMNFDAWKGNLGYEDLTGDGAPGTWDDYVAWWQSQGFSPEQFAEVNGTDFNNPSF